MEGELGELRHKKTFEFSYFLTAVFLFLSEEDTIMSTCNFRF